MKQLAKANLKKKLKIPLTRLVIAISITRTPFVYTPSDFYQKSSCYYVKRLFF